MSVPPYCQLARAALDAIGNAECVRVFGRDSIRLLYGAKMGDMTEREFAMIAPALRAAGYQRGGLPDSPLVRALRLARDISNA